MTPTNVYSVFLGVKALLNFGAAFAAWKILKNPQMAGFWLFIGIADMWVAVWSWRND